MRVMRSTLFRHVITGSDGPDPLEVKRDKVRAFLTILGELGKI